MLNIQETKFQPDEFILFALSCGSKVILFIYRYLCCTHSWGTILSYLRITYTSDYCQYAGESCSAGTSIVSVFS